MLVADVIKVLTLITHSITGTGTRAYNRDVQAVHRPSVGKQEREEKDFIFFPCMVFEKQGDSTSRQDVLLREFKWKRQRNHATSSIGEKN